MLRILTYNLCWEACSYNKWCKGHSCRDNIMKWIKEAQKRNKYDFVALQEVNNDVMPKLKGMKVVSNRLGEGQLTYYNDSFELEFVTKGFMKDMGRMLTILFFKKPRLCFINVHAGHNGDIYKLWNYIKKFTPKEYLQRLKTDLVILAGDLNNSLGRPLKIAGRTFKGVNYKRTCCGRESRKVADHILYIERSPLVGKLTLLVHKTDMQSDHLPLSGQLSLSK